MKQQLVTEYSPLNYLVEGVKEGQAVQIAGTEYGRAAELAMHFLRGVGSAAYFNLSGQMDKDLAMDLLGSDVLVCEEDSGNKAMEILTYLVTHNQVDRVVIDDVPGVVADEERGKYNEFAGIELLADALRQLKIPCMRNRISIILVNQIRFDEKGQYRMYGRSVIAGKTSLSLLTERRRYLYRDKIQIGEELRVRTVSGKASSAGKQTFIALLDRQISDVHWIIKQAMQANVIEKDGNRLIYRGQPYDPWYLLDLAEKDVDLVSQLSKEVSADGS